MTYSSRGWSAAAAASPRGDGARPLLPLLVGTERPLLLPLAGTERQLLPPLARTELALLLPLAGTERGRCYVPS